MSKKSAGILAYRFNGSNVEVFLVHLGGPFWAKKDAGAWSIPKGEFENEESLPAAKREFFEETGITIDGTFIELTPLKLKSGKVIFAWAIEKDIDVISIKSNEFELEWPPRSGKKQMFPEIDKAGWFDPRTGMEKINQGQAGFIRELAEKLNIDLNDKSESV